MENKWLLRLAGVIVLLALRGSTTTLVRIEAQVPSGLVPSMTECQLSELVLAEPPRDPNADPFGRGPWYVNADRSIWAGWLAGRWVSGTNGNKVLWIRARNESQGGRASARRRRCRGTQRRHSMLLSNQFSGEPSLFPHVWLLGGHGNGRRQGAQVRDQDSVEAAEQRAGAVTPAVRTSLSRSARLSARR